MTRYRVRPLQNGTFVAEMRTGYVEGSPYAWADPMGDSGSRANQGSREKVEAWIREQLRERWEQALKDQAYAKFVTENPPYLYPPDEAE